VVRESVRTRTFWLFPRRTTSLVNWLGGIVDLVALFLAVVRNEDVLFCSNIKIIDGIPLGRGGQTVDRDRLVDVLQFLRRSWLEFINLCYTFVI